MVFTLLSAPMASRYMEMAVETFGMPEIDWLGDKSEYSPWQNVEKVMVESLDRLEELTATDWFFSIANEMHPYFKPRARTKAVIFFRKLIKPLRGLVFVRKSEHTDS